MSSKNNWEDMPEGMLEPVRISGGDAKAFKALVLLLLGIVAVGGILTKSYVAGIICLSLFVMVLLVFGTRHAHADQYRRGHDMIQGGRITTVVYEEKKHAYGIRDQGSIFREIRTNTNPDPIWITLEEYLARKIENMSMEIFGRMGTGKTTLGLKVLEVTDKAYQRIVFGYKRRDSGKYQRLGYERWDMRAHRANPWSNKDAFIRALVAAIDLNPGSGITANSVEDLIADTIRKCNGWEQLFVEIKLSINDAVKSKDNVTRMALARIQRALKVIYDPNAKYFTIPERNIFLDYSNVKNRTISTFDSEFLLELLYDEIIDEKRNKVLIYIDEAHRLLKNRYDQGNNVSIIEDLISREIRATGSRLVICTQSYQDVSPTARDQPATQFMFRTQEPKTIAELREISELLDQAVQDLDIYNFVDIAQDFNGYKVRDRILHFRLYPKTIEEPAIEPKPEPITPAPLLTPMPQPQSIEEQEPLPSAGCLMKIIDMLEKEPMTTQEIATRLVTEEQRPDGAPADWQPTSQQINSKKLELTDKRVFRKLVSIEDGDLADVLLIQDEYKDKSKSLYFRKDKGEKAVHARLMVAAREKLQDPKYHITKIIEGEDRKGADFEIPGYFIEVESDLRKGNMKDIDLRIAEAMKGPSSAVVLVPNDSAAEKYKEHFAKKEKENEALKGRITVLVLYELGFFLNSLSKKPLISEERTNRRW